MRSLCLSALAGALAIASNVTFFGAPRFSLHDTLPNRDSHGNVLIAQDLEDTVDKPSCKGGSSANARSIAYYQEWNIRTRSCDTVRPSQIKVDGLTQLNLAFAYIDPKTFQIRLQNSQDDTVYREFVELKNGGIQVWLGVGGWEFSDEGPTRTTWSDLASSAANRKTFITSTLQFLKDYGFQGLDVDWEWPASSSRGGRPDDTQNQVNLMKELRDALGKDYGLTCVLPHDNTFLHGIDVKGLSQHVDWFNILTYDLHGSWDENNPALGARIRPHTDLKEIDAHLEALWATGVDPSKFTLGLAYYGRGYTVADPKCPYYGCSFTGPSTRGNCSAQAGVLSGCEIKRIIKDQNLTPSLIEGGTSAMQLSWGNQWISYDNDRTFALKKDFANERCMGGTAVWAIDYDSCDNNGQLPPMGPDHSSAPSVVHPVSSIVSSAHSSDEVPQTSEGSLSMSSTATHTSVNLGSSTGFIASTPPVATSSTTKSSMSSASSPMSRSSAVGSSNAESLTSFASSVSVDISFGLSSSSLSSNSRLSSDPSASATTSYELSSSQGGHSSSLSKSTSTTSWSISSDPTFMSFSLVTTSKTETSFDRSSSPSTAVRSSWLSKSSSATDTLRSISTLEPQSSSTTPNISSGISVPSGIISSTRLIPSTSSSNATTSTSSGVPAIIPWPAIHTKKGCTADFGMSAPSNFLNAPSDIWSNTSAALRCSPPCIFDLPTSILSLNNTFPCPNITGTFLTIGGGSTVTTTKEIPTFACGSVTKVEITNVFVRGGSTGTTTSVITQAPIVTNMMSFWPVTVTNVSQSFVQPILKGQCQAKQTTLLPGLLPLPSPGQPTPTEWSNNIRYCMFPQEYPYHFWNLPWQCCMFDWCLALYTMTPFPTAAPQECKDLDWCIGFPWNDTRNSTPSTTTASSLPVVAPIPVTVCTKNCDDSDSDDEFPIVPWIMLPKFDCPKDSERAKKGLARGFFGCGCGWSGLPYGPGCSKPPKCGFKPWFPIPDIECWLKWSIDILWWTITPCGQLFECNPCKWVGCPDLHPEIPCGIIGCDGYCHSENGCDPDCPAEVCGTCKDCQNIKPGPPPGGKNHPTKPSETAESTRKPMCKPKDYVTVTEVLSLCVKKSMPVLIAHNKTSTTTISTCTAQSMTFGGCPPLEGLTTTEWQTLTDTASCTESSTIYSTFSSCLVSWDTTGRTPTSSCMSTVSPIVGCGITGGATKTVSTTSCSVSSTVYSTFSSCLVGTDSVGGTQTSSCLSTVSPIVGCDVTGGATKTVSTTSDPGGCTLAPLIWGEDEGINSGLPRNGSVMTTGIPIPYLEMMRNATTSGGSCPWSPLIIEDDDGDNFNDTIVIPTLFMKNDTSGGSCPWVGLDINDAEGDNPQNITIEIPTLSTKNYTSGASCPLSPLVINDDEGDNFSNTTIAIPSLPMKTDTISIPSLPMNTDTISIPSLPMNTDTISIPSLPMNTDTISIPSLPMKTDTVSIPELSMKTNTVSIPELSMKTNTVSIPELSMKTNTVSIPELSMKHDMTSIGKPVAPTLAHETIAEQKVAPTLAQTAHPTPSATPTEALGPKPIQAGGKWEIMINQKMSDIHWRLLDPGQNEAGVGDDSQPIQCFGRPQKDCFPFDIEFTVGKNAVGNPVDFEIMINLPSGRRLKFNDLQDSADLPEDGYPSENYGCKNDSRNVRIDATHRIYWCHFEWLGAGGWDGQSDGPVPKDL